MRQLLWHRHRMVQARTRIMNQLQAVALDEGLCWKTGCSAMVGTGLGIERAGPLTTIPVPS